ncbi:ABC transporter substrate-binding protein [Escherichia coli]|nr:ABC transporter substrate-binding protein [Escherichia coli]CAD5562441.1 ABC transporter substrate-binding protein [Escherichia coli]
MPKKMRTTRNLLLMATLLGSVLFARAADKEMTIGAIYLDTQGYYAGVRQGVQDAAKDSSVQVQGNDSNLLIVFYVQIMPDDFVMQLHRF